MNKTQQTIAQRRKQVLGRLLVRASKSVQAHHIAQIKAGGYDDYRLGDNAVLVHLEQQGNRISTLAERCGLTKQAVSQLVNDLQKRGVVYKTRDPNDGRAQIVRFTELGLEILEAGVSAVEHTDAVIEDILGAQQAAQLRAHLSALLEHFDPGGF